MNSFTDTDAARIQSADTALVVPTRILTIVLRVIQAMNRQV